MSFADVIIDISHEKLDRPFQYRIPEAMAPEVSPGTWVKIPFGKSNKPIKGYVVSISDKALIPDRGKPLRQSSRGGVVEPDSITHGVSSFRVHFFSK